VADNTRAVFEIASRAVRNADDFEGLVRPLLAALQEATDFDSTYLTAIHFEDAKQEILFSLNTRELQITEGMLVDWCDTLCREALLGKPAVVEDAQQTYPDSNAAAELGIRSYASVPITLPDGSTVGTMCGASRSRLAIDESHQDLFRIFAVLVAEAMGRERLLAETRQAAADAEDRLRERLTAVASAQHLFKTPLTVLYGWSSLLLSHPAAQEDGRLRDGLRVVQQETAHLRQLVDDLLSATRESYRPRRLLHLQVLDVSDTLSDLVVGHAAASAKQRWEIDLDRGLVARVDVPAFEQLVGHLLDNASKYGGEDATIAVDARVDPDGRLVVNITDDGPGLPPNLEVFAPFERAADHSATGDVSQVEGVGIGLYLVKSIADAHGATIDFVSVQPHGTRVTVTLPAP
jgi:signal transduction histidine kinase